MTKYRSKDGARGGDSVPPGYRATNNPIGVTGVGDDPPGWAWELEEMQPHCPRDGAVLHDVDGAISYPECGYSIPVPRVEMPPEFDGPAFKGF